MLQEAFEANQKAKEYKKLYEELRESIVDATKGLEEKILIEGEYTAKVKYVESVEYTNIEEAQKLLPADCFRVVVNTDVVKALEKAGKVDSKKLDKCRKYSYNTPRVTVDRS